MSDFFHEEALEALEDAGYTGVGVPLPVPEYSFVKSFGHPSKPAIMIPVNDEGRILEGTPATLGDLAENGMVEQRAGLPSRVGTDELFPKKTFGSGRKLALPKLVK